MKCKIQIATARTGLDTTTLNWFNVAQLALQTPAPEILKRPHRGPIRLGLHFTGYGTDSLACHYLGVNYKVALFTEQSSAKKDTLRVALEKKHPTHKKPMAMYYDVRGRSTKDVPRCDVFVTRPPCVTMVGLKKKLVGPQYIQEQTPFEQTT